MLLVRIATWMEACIWLAFINFPNTFLIVVLLDAYFLVFFQNAILAQFEGVTLFWLETEEAKLYGKIRKMGISWFIVGVL